MPIAGGAWYLSNLNGVNSWLIPILSGGYGGHAPWQFAAKNPHLSYDNDLRVDLVCEILD